MVELDPALPVQILTSLLIAAVAVILVKAVNRVMLTIVDEKNPDRKRILSNIQRFVQIFSYSIALVLILWTFNVDITGILAGLGVGALVIGFALKDIIENWVSGLLIFSGKTYKIGDVIAVGEMKGVVTELSLRTTTLKTYDRNMIIIPNSVVLKERIVNLTGGGKETVVTLVFAVDYIFEVSLVKNVIRKVLLNYKHVVVDEKRKRELRFLVRDKEWTTEVEALFWVDNAENGEFIKSEVTELVKKEFTEEKILPPLPAVMRKEFLEPKKMNLAKLIAQATQSCRAFSSTLLMVSPLKL
ncbi:MAG: mechanosensitive ion channel family protein [Candidatus Bathyarchaeota archaeon]|nr:mechanosensitive ion channel family protein [Candidatus Bathyarchaeota archaeon]